MAGKENLQFKMDCDLQWDHGILHTSDLDLNTCEGFDLCTQIWLEIEDRTPQRK
jgi:hypothetical protein